MIRFNRYVLIAGIIATMILSTGAFAAENPCNPCGGAATNPCNPCNPCAGLKHFGIDDPGGRDVLTFDSKAPLEKNRRHNQQNYGSHSGQSKGHHQGVESILCIRSRQSEDRNRQTR